MSDNITNSGAGCCSPCGNQNIIVNTGNVNFSNTLYLSGDPPTRTLTVVGDGLISNMVSTSSFYSPGFTSNSTTMRLTSNLTVNGSAYISDDLSVSNLTVRNTLGVTGAMTSNVDNTTFFYDTFTIPYLNTNQLVVSGTFTTTNVFANQGTFTNLHSANSLTTTNVFATNIYGSIAGSNTIGGSTITASTQFSGPGTGLTGSAASLSAGGLTGTPNITVGTVGGTTITASTQFSGPGTGLTGSAASLSAGGLTGTPNITVGTVGGTTITASTQFSGPGTGLTGSAASFSAGGLTGTPNITVGTVGGTTITASTQFSGPGTGLTGSAASLSAGGLTGTPNITVATITGTQGTFTNLYSSNSLTTTNVFAVTATVPGFTSQFTVNGGGTVTWSADGNLLWSQRVIVIPTWRNAAYATFGYWDITCPVSGTIVSNGGTATCTAAGIPVGGWFALYYRVVPGTAATSVQANFILKDFGDTTYSPDSNWILLAVRNSDSNEIKWIPGNTTIPSGGIFYTPSASFDKVQVAGTVVVDSARTGIFNNLYSANALTTTNVFATQGTFTNLYSSNALTTTNVFATQGTFSNSVSTNNVTVSNTLTVANAFTSNATTTNFSFDTFTVPFVNCTTLNVASVSNLTTMTMQGTTDATTLFVTGNVYVSNAVTASNLFATSNIGVGVNVPATTVQVNGQISSKSGGAYGILPPLTWRQGSSATNWNTAGPTNYSLAIGQPQMQCGSNTMVASPQTITFPLAYTNIPIVMITPYAISSNAAYVSSVTISNFQVTCPSNIPFEWLAIGI